MNSICVWICMCESKIDLCVFLCMGYRMRSVCHSPSFQIKIEIDFETRNKPKVLGTNTNKKSSHIWNLKSCVGFIFGNETLTCSDDTENFETVYICMCCVLRTQKDVHPGHQF